MENKIDAIAADITDIKVMLAKNSVVLDRNVEDLAEHMRRTHILEEQMRVAILPVRILKWLVAVVPLVAFIAKLVLMTQQKP